MPSIAGKVACYMEKHYVLNGVWPTPDQAKATILSEARNEIRDNTPSTTWSNVPTASDNDFYPLYQDPSRNVLPLCNRHT